MGIGPATLREGDYVCIILGANMPFIMRKGGELFRLIEPAYVEDIMERQAIGDGKMVGVI